MKASKERESISPFLHRIAFVPRLALLWLGEAAAKAHRLSKSRNRIFQSVLSMTDWFLCKESLYRCDSHDLSTCRLANERVGIRRGKNPLPKRHNRSGALLVRHMTMMQDQFWGLLLGFMALGEFYPSCSLDSKPH